MASLKKIGLKLFTLTLFRPTVSRKMIMEKVKNEHWREKRSDGLKNITWPKIGIPLVEVQTRIQNAQNRVMVNKFQVFLLGLTDQNSFSRNTICRDMKKKQATTPKVCATFANTSI